METLLFSINNHIATISFNRPQAMNAFNDVMANELEAVTEQIKLDENIRVVLLNGAGKLFMAGGDIYFFGERLESMPNGVTKLVRTLNASILNLMRMPKPVVASVHGSVAGAGVSLMIACDLIIAADTTKFTSAYSSIGISPDGGASFNLPRIVGTKKAMEWLMLSELIDAPTAEKYGLINRIVPAAELQAETERLLQKLAKGPTHSYAQVKRLMNQTWHASLETQLENEAAAFTSCTMSQDFKNGVISFLQKKVPEFTGR